MVPLSAPIILDNYPPKEHSKALSVWSIGVFGGSFVGPVIGGYLVDYLSWRWVFYINIPFGIIAFLGLLFFMQESIKDKNSRLDWFGFLSLAIGVSALQVMADRGHRLDWFDSPEIVLEGLIACLALYLFAMHTITSRRPLLDPTLLYIRQFRIAVLLLAFYGILQTPVIVVMPVFLEDLIGYPVKSVGLLQLPRGIGLLIGLIVAGRLSGRVDPRFLLAFGFVSVAVSNFAMAQWSLEVSQASIIWTGAFQGIGGAFIMLPTQEIAFYGSHPTQRTDASAIMNLIRSMCSSLGVSITLILYFINSGISRNDLIPNINLYSDSFNTTDTNIRSTQALAQMNQEIDRQASMLGYDGAFLFLAILAVIPIVMLLFTKKLLVGDQKSN